MTRRASIPLAGMLLVAAVGLTGCQAAGSFNRTDAQADTATWTKSAVAAAASPTPHATTKLSGFETCRTDTGYFTTTTQWRTITDVDVPSARQHAATAAIVRSFVANGWKQSRPGGLVTLQGGGRGKLRGLITIQSAGPSALAITVESPCYA